MTGSLGRKFGNQWDMLKQISNERVKKKEKKWYNFGIWKRTFISTFTFSRNLLSCKLLNTSRQHYSYFGGHAIFSESSASCLGDLGQKALQTTIEPTLFVDFCLIPLSNTCSFVRPARNVNREIFIHCQEGFCVGKFGRVVDQAVLDNRPLRKHFRLRSKRQALLKILKMSMRKRFYFGVLT